MSLFLGNLSPRTRREELAQLFRRFGRSNVQLKDGYGFVIYEFPGNAERALKALRGKTICGQQISVTWANKQPRAFQRFSRSTNYHKPYRVRNPREEAINFRNRDSYDQRSFIMRQPFNGHRGPQLPDADAVDKETGCHEEIDVVGEEKHPNSREGLPDEDRTNEGNPVGNDRWGATVSDSTGGNLAENETDFERYVPNHGYERADDDANHRTHTPNSAERRSSPEKGHREHSPKSQQICFVCGLVGHKMRNCPQRDSSRRDRFGKLESRRHHETNFRGRSEGRLKRTKATSLGMRHADRNPSLTISHGSDRRRSHSGKPKRLARSERIPESKRFSKKVLKESQWKRRREHETPKDHLKKRRMRRPAASSLHSDSTATSSRSSSPSSRSTSSISSRSRSRSVSLRTLSVSTSSKSASVSSYSKSASSRSRSNLHKSLSLSISLDQKSQSSPKNMHLDASNQSPVKAELDVVSAPVFEHPLVANSEDSKLGGELKNDNATSLIVNDDISGEQLGHVELGNSSACHIGNNKQESCMVQQEKAFSERSFENHGERAGHWRPQSDTENLKIPVGIGPGNSIELSSLEMCTVLKHYGLTGQEKCEPGLSVNAYFGAARMWPWEMIYYRRLKKGPISTENYARRVAQNREFGIVDRYIRSSSGWAECGGTDA